MKTNEATIFVFIASIIIGVLISSNMNLKKINNKVFLTPTEYQEAYDYVNKLNKDISNLQETYYKERKKLEKYLENQNDKFQIIREMNKEIFNNEMTLGNIDVEGQGIVIKLKDASSDFSGNVEDAIDQKAGIIHDNDIINLVNELKNAGAEVISINGQRIIDKSDIFCWGAFIELDGIKIPAPFNIKVIGNKDKIYSYMTSDMGYLTYLKLRGIDVNIIKSDKIKILANEGKIEYKYMTEVKKDNTK
ncbi:DUF881 domain-containing protein [Clostridium ganghwense]|uniref:DUF881 domain-containing protein n=1 Tax=Clostridium ganghwense TaxID=312089 RepID=A0ABT4CMS6_9CLOT|nr:DUF881 domain-containing protein [Clostridium ganghwense]MCY6370350.1 DUF881 domain-containing protein [Clostridium ganghwense]